MVLLLRGPFFILLPEEKQDQPSQLLQQGQDIPPVVDEDGDQRAQVQEHVKKQVPVGARQTEEVLEQGKVAGAGDGQKLGNALDQPQEKRG